MLKQLSIENLETVIVPEYFGSIQQGLLISRASRICVATGLNYQKQTCENRCRIRTPDGLLWLTIPTRRLGIRTALNQTQIENGSRWAVKHWRAFEFNYRSTPYFEHYEPYLFRLFERRYEYLSEFTIDATRALIECLSLAPELRVTPLTDLRFSFATKDKSMEGVAYRQNFPGFLAGTSVVDRLFNLGPHWDDGLL